MAEATTVVAAEGPSSSPRKEQELQNQVAQLQAEMSSIAAAAKRVNQSATAKAAQAQWLSRENQRLKKEIEELETNSTALTEGILREALQNVTEARQRSEALRSQLERVTDEARANVTAAGNQTAAAV